MKKKVMLRELGAGAEPPSTRHGGRARASRDSCHAADDDKNRVATAALGRDAPPKQKWEPPS